MRKLNILVLFLLTFSGSILYSQIPAPTNLTAEFKYYSPTPTNTYGFVELNWVYTFPSTGGIFFKIYRKEFNEANFKVIAQGVRGLKFIDNKVLSEKTYSYYVVAYNNLVTSGPSDTATVTTPPIPDVLRFVTYPPKTGSIGVLYSYDADAVSNMPNTVITYSLVEAPAGMTINETTGLINWTPSSSGYFKTKIKAQSNRGGVAYQEWTIRVTGSTGTISGIVISEQNNQPLADVSVYFLSLTSPIHVVAKTNMNGEFTKTLVEGSYRVKFYKRGFIPEFFDNKPRLELADTIIISANSNVVINASLTPVPLPTLYTISGSVLNANGEPVRSMVTAFLVRDTLFPVLAPNLIPRNMSVITDSLGHYQIRVMGGFQYVVFAKAFSRDYLPEFYDNKRTFQEADRILVNNNISNINFVMDLRPVYNNGIAGSIQHFGTGTGVEGIVSAYRLVDGRFRPMKSVRTDSIGNFLIDNLEPGNYILFAKPRPPYLPGYYKDGSIAWHWRQADTIIVSETGIISGLIINVKSRQDTGFAKVTGRLRTIYGENVAGKLVVLINLEGQVVATQESDNNGNYQIEYVPAGTYIVSVDATDYDDVTTDNMITLNYGSGAIANKDLTLSPASTTSVKQTQTLPTTYSLMQNYPNPFNPSTKIKFVIPKQTTVKLEIYNLIGQKIAELVNDELSAGTYEVIFNGENLTSGVYLYRMEAGDFVSVKKMLLMK